ncbi:MAG: SDR family oxidoreductase [Hyphomonadaceae bacterium]
MSLQLLDASGRVLLLSGAAGGIGSALAERYLAAGGKVAALDRAPPPQRDGVLSIACDVTDAAAVNAAVAQTLKQFGRIDALVHAAGVVGAGPLADTPSDDWQSVLDANLTSAFLLTRAAHAALKDANGAVVFLGSTNGLNGGSALSGAAYASAKAGLANLARYLAKEWAPHVRAATLAAGPVETPMLARLDAATLRALQAQMLTRRLIEADEAAACIAFLLSDHARSITGATLNLSGGLVLD